MIDKLEEATKLAKKLERAYDTGSKIGARIHGLGASWEAMIAPLKADIAEAQAKIDALIEERDAGEGIKKWSARLATVYNFELDLKDHLTILAADLVDDQAFFPSGKKSQELTDRVTLKSQMPTTPVILDLHQFLRLSLRDNSLGLVTKKISVDLDGPVAVKWMASWEGEDVTTGLGPPKPKILNIKVKEKTT